MTSASPYLQLFFIRKQRKHRGGTGENSRETDHEKLADVQRSLGSRKPSSHRGGDNKETHNRPAIGRPQTVIAPIEHAWPHGTPVRDVLSL